PSAAALTVDDQVVTALDRDGRYLELTETGVDAAVDDANQLGIAFVWLDQPAEIDVTEGLADGYVLALEDVGSAYHTVLVLTLDAYAAFSTVYDDGEVDQALEASFASFSSGSASRGVDAFTASLDAAAPAGQSTATTVPGQSADGAADDSGGGIGLGTILLILAVGGGGFWMFRRWRSNRRAREQAAHDLEEDKLEIEEQLKNNADRVISLGDRVIASGNKELIALYEEATEAYQDVSHRLAETDSAAAIDELDDRIDRAEWQFQVIQARLDGRPAPPEPDYRDDPPVEPEDVPVPRPPAPTSADQRGAQGDRSVITSPTTGREYPRPAPRSGQAPARPAPRQRSRRRSGGLGGGLGGALGGVIGNIILGGGLGGVSRRTTRRTRDFSMPDMGGSGRRSAGAGGLGGGVLRRGGGSPQPRSRSNTRARTRPQRRSGSTRGGGRSLGNRRGGGRSL
ncbi:MAG: hypothetical protein AAF531_17945, partial [Actinomycetota bacterium]